MIVQEIEAMCGAEQGSVAYFYFDTRDADKQNLHNLVPSLLSQLSASSERRRDILTDLYSRHDKGIKRPSDSNLVESLKRIPGLPGQRPTYPMMDAVDECPNNFGIPTPRTRVLQLIQDAVEHRLSQLHICVTSRRQANIHVYASDGAQINVTRYIPSRHAHGLSSASR